TVRRETQNVLMPMRRPTIFEAPVGRVHLDSSNRINGDRIAPVRQVNCFRGSPDGPVQPATGPKPIRLHQRFQEEARGADDRQACPQESEKSSSGSQGGIVTANAID